MIICLKAHMLRLNTLVELLLTLIKVIITLTFRINI